MAFLLNISSGPRSPFTQASLRFAQAAVENGEDITGCFFQGDAVQLFSKFSPEPEMKQAWLEFLAEIKQPALCCSAAAHKHPDVHATDKQIDIVGLGELISLSKAAKVVCFGDA